MQRKRFLVGRAFLRKSVNLKAILTNYRIMYTNESLETRLDQNPDVLPVRQGVIDLQTGLLRNGAASDYMSQQLDHHRAHGFTGVVHVHWKGINGKSLLASLLEDLLENWVVTAPYEIFFRGDQRAREGSHSTHLGTLKGARICIKEEVEPKDKLNTETLKTVTGGGSITMRGAYARDFETFKPMCLPILLCNHRPEVDITDEAMMRRIVVVPFNNIYTTLDDPKRPFNEANPTHRLRDPELKHKLLNQQPPAMLRAFQEYNDENDKLQQFIRSHCEVEVLHRVNATDFRTQYCKAMHTSIMQIKLSEIMHEKGFKAAFHQKDDGKRERIYSGLSLCDSAAAVAAF
ncbi:hypothetical protein BGZ46_005635 [Entomortierella lignicola]|nr:hypothetical protein BGZ46_005635 [Entomortierella lignicola]